MLHSSIDFFAQLQSTQTGRIRRDIWRHLSRDRGGIHIHQLKLLNKVLGWHQLPHDVHAKRLDYESLRNYHPEEIRTLLKSCGIVSASKD